MPVGLHVENGFAQQVAFDGCIVLTVGWHDAVKCFFEARPTTFHEYVEDSGIVFRSQPLGRLAH
jgi:hypothetical protein